MVKKIALCFLTYNNLSKPILWTPFINSKYNIYIHNKTDFRGVFKQYCIKNKVETKWGDISLVNATLNLFKEAFENKENEYFILLSCKCIPLYSPDEIYNKITTIDNNIISCFSSTKNGCSTFPNWNKRQHNDRFNSLNKKNFFDKTKFVKQHQWMVLNRKTVDFFIKNDYTNIFGNGFTVPDEHYFINIILKFNISFVNKSITFVNRNQPSDSKKYNKFPKTYSTLTNKMIGQILKSDTLFMRKVIPECKLPSYFDV
jgi:hypothetical protein